jgi:hypothetical protein
LKIAGPLVPEVASTIAQFNPSVLKVVIVFNEQQITHSRGIARDNVARC